MCIHRWKSKRILTALLTVLFLVTQLLTVSPVFAAESGTSRLSGEDRYQTAVAVSQQGWQNADYAVLARGDDFADALCAGPLAYQYNGPILLTQTGTLNTATLNELKRLGVKNVFIVGGTGAISIGVENTLKQSGISAVERIYGSDRYETSVKIAEKIGISSNVVLATGSDFPDALSVSAVAAKKKMPILLTAKDGLPSSVKAYLQGKSIANTYVIGGTGVISSGVENAVPSPIRLAGNDRYETNTAILKHFAKELKFESVYVAVGSKFADALTGAVLAAKNAAPLVLTSDALPQTTSNYLKENITKDSKIVGLGGTASVSSNVLSGIGNIRDSVATTPVTPPASSGGGGGGGGGTVAVTGVSVDQSTLTLLAGGATGTLTASVSPSNATNKTVNWTSGNTAVATVVNGVITPAGVGSATITATSAADGTKTATTTITVTATPTVNSVAELTAALNATGVTSVTLGSDITGDVTATRTGTTNFEIAFGNKTLTGNLAITANNVAQIAFNGDAGNRIIGNLTLTAPVATVNNDVAISGSAILNGVGFSSYNATKAHGLGIVMAGQGRLNLSSAASSAPITVETAQPVTLAGTITGNVTIVAAGAKTTAEGTISKIIVAPTATGSIVQVATGSTVTALEAKADITLAKEEGVTVPTPTGTGKVTPKTSYRVTFDKNTGTTEADPSFMLVVQNESAGILPTAPSKTGHTFASWNTAANGGGTSFNASTTVTGSITVFAQWTINTYNVTFDKNTGTTDANPTTKTATHNGNVGTLPTAPTKNGYTFASWNTAANGSGTSFTAATAVTGNVTVYAQWTANQAATSVLLYSKITGIGMPTSDVKIKLTASDNSYLGSFALYFDNVQLASTTTGSVTVASALLQDLTRIKIRVSSTDYSVASKTAVDSW